eukprot:6883995-Prymnesium_polylepis.1
MLYISLDPQEGSRAALAVLVLVLSVLAFCGGRLLMRCRRRCKRCCCGLLGRRKSRDRGRHDWLPPDASDEDDEDEDMVVRTPAERQRCPPAAQQQLEARMLAVETMVNAMHTEQEQTRAALTAQLEAERATRAMHAAATSRLLDEVCEVLQRELASEKNHRLDALAEVRATISHLETNRQQPATFVNL